MRSSVAIVGAAGACGRQLAVDLLEQSVEIPGSRLQLVGHRGGASEQQLHGLRADLRDAYSDWAPEIEIVLDPEEVSAEIVVMLAGETIPTDPTADVDREHLAQSNHAMFSSYARVLARSGGPRPFVVVQSNPVELGVHAFAEELGPEQVVGAGAHSDTQRFRRELAASLGLRRPEVSALVAGQHGDHLVPLWSCISTEGGAATAAVEALRGGRALSSLPDEIVALRTELLGMVAAGMPDEAFERLSSAPPDLRAAVRPFLIHYSSGHTTEIMTARAVEEVLRALIFDHPLETSLQVALEGEWAEIRGVTGAPVVIDAGGWRPRSEIAPAADEHEAIELAAAVTSATISSLR